MMERILFIVTTILCFSITKCNLTDRNKTMDGIIRELDSQDTANNKYRNVSSEGLFYSLKSQNWSADEEPCLNDTLRLLRSLQNFTMWAVWNWEAISSEPQGLLFGSRYQLGNFDECMSAPWSKTHAELRTQYCLADIVLESQENSVKRHIDIFEPYQSALDFIQYRPPHLRPLNELTWGICVPASCKPRSVESLFRTAITRSYLGTANVRPLITITDPCQKIDEPRPFDEAFYAFIYTAGLLTAIALLCTFLNSRREKTDLHSIKHQVIKAFCIKENARDLLRMKKDGIEVLYGIRYLSICFIVMDHQIGIFNAGPISNALHADQVTWSPVGMLLLHDDLFVDTFFFLSGFLVAITLKSLKKLPNPILIILKRYIRLVIAFAVVVFYACAIHSYTGSGPLWSKAIAADTEPCRKNWWRSLLMINNYIDSENICIIASWYIPCDFHFFVVTVLLFWTYKRAPRLGATCAGILAIASILIPATINYLNELPAIQLLTYEFIKNPRASKQFHLTYIKSHTRFATYLVGLASGFVFAHYKATGNIKRISKKWSVVGACTGLLVMMTVMLTGATYLWRSYHPLEGALYAAVNRPVWTFGVSIFVLSCSLGHVPIIKDFLSWYPWVPLSRLAYGLYLTHTIFITRNILVARNPRHNDPPELMNLTIGVIFWGSLSAFIIWLLAEAPANNLLNICLKPIVKKAKLEENNSSLGVNV